MTNPDVTDSSPIDNRVSYISDTHQYLQETGISPDELIFRFKCQKCGFRCCFNTFENTIVFSPYTFSYIRKTIPESLLKYFFDSQLLKWVIYSQSGPSLQLGGTMCPFLIFHWDDSAEKLFQKKINSLNKESSPALQFILIHIVRSISKQYDEFIQIQAQNKITGFMGLPVYSLIPIFLSVWNLVTHNHPLLYPNNDPDSFLIQFLEFLTLPSDAHPRFHARCSIWSVRPQVCRIFPLGRWMTLKSSISKHSYKILTPDIQKVILKTEICPPVAFQTGKEKKASQFILEQGVTEYEYTVINRVTNFLHQYSPFLENLTIEELNQFHQILLANIYYKVDYNKEVVVFIEELHMLLEGFFQSIHSLFQ
jgi:Fe-S-cluster containining protein